MRRWLPATSIRTRLLLVYVGIILLGFSIITLIAGGQITTAARADYEERLQNEIRLIAQGITASLTAYSANQITEATLENGIKTYGGEVSGTLTFYPMGEGLYPRPDPDNERMSFRNMPEMETALRGETVLVERKDSSGRDTLYTAAPIFYQQKLAGIVQLSVPTVNLQSIVWGRWAVLGIVFVLVTALALIAALWLAQSIIHPLYQLREAARRLSHGDFSHRVAHIGRDETGEVVGAFNEMAHQVQSMLEEQRAFASNTSHELRTPLTSIRLRTDALRHDPTLDEATTRQYIAEIDDEVAGLSNLVQDLTLLSRFDAGRAELGQNQIDFGRLASNLIQQVAAHAQDKQIEITVSAPDEPVLVYASLSHLTVVFRNLLDNALKYTPGGGKITWKIKPVDTDVFHSIQDTGQGIAPQHLPRIYERFYRADKARSRDIPGTGLGLALAKSIIDAYGGTISIESEGAGKGTTAKVFWPFAPVSQHQPA